jgi:hypothetical protein
MAPEAHGSSTATTRPTVAAEDVHWNGSVEAPSTNAPIDDSAFQTVKPSVGR